MVQTLMVAFAPGTAVPKGSTINRFLQVRHSESQQALHANESSPLKVEISDIS